MGPPLKGASAMLALSGRESNRFAPDLRSSFLVSLGFGEGPEGGDHLGVGVALEGDDRVERLVQPRPAPLVELGVGVGLEVELGGLAGEAEGQRFLLLAAPALGDLLAVRFGGEVVDDPVLGLAEL